MSDPRTIVWLAQLQARFGQALRTPLDRASGTLRAQTASYGQALCEELLPGPRTSVRDRLAVYNRQYWFRLFTALQREYPLTAQLVGMWMFNELVARYLVTHPPSHFDLQQIAPGFVGFLRVALSSERAFADVPSAAILEAASIDRGFAQVFLAPEERALDAARLARTDFAQTRLRQSASVVFLSEHWPLVELRRALARASDAKTLRLPDAHAQAQYWVIRRAGQGQLSTKLEPLAFRLFTALAAGRIADALGALEASCPAHERAALPGRVQGWLADSVRAGFWVEPP